MDWIIVDEDIKTMMSPEELSRLETRLLSMCRLASKEEGADHDFECSLRLCNDDVIKELNFRYRKKDKSTDVLAFALQEAQMGQWMPGALGDIVISLETALSQKKDKPLYEEVTFLMAHGFCHLLGYDHQNDAEELAMNKRMADLLEKSAH